jgi:uncharacterized protein
MDTRTNPRTDTRPDSKNRLFLRILRFPLTRMLLLSCGLLYAYMSGYQFLANYAKTPVQLLAASAVMVASLFYMYASLVYLVERRPVSELALPRLGRELGIGLLLGFSLYVTCVLIAMALGLYRIEGVNSWQILLPSLWAAPLAPVFEELLFRGVAFRILEEVFGGWVALVASSVVFGLVHMGNAGETFAGIASIALVYGPLLAAPYMLTRRLWAGIGLHGAWNYTMGNIFSSAVSGNATSQGLFKTTFQGPELLTGGNAGMEGSLIAMLVTATASVLLLILAVRRGKIVPPFWKRRIARPGLNP